MRSYSTKGGVEMPSLLDFGIVHAAEMKEFILKMNFRYWAVKLTFRRPNLAAKGENVSPKNSGSE